MKFEIVGRITNVEVIASGSGTRVRRFLRKAYGSGRWRKLKGGLGPEERQKILDFYKQRYGE